jgi:hypothetical protein
MATKFRDPSLDLPFFKLFVRDWLSRMRGVSIAAQGAFMYLLCVSWERRRLPNDSEACRKIVGTDARDWRRVWPEIVPHLEEHAGALVCPWLEDLHVKASASRGAQINGGIETARKARGKKSGPMSEVPYEVTREASRAVGNTPGMVLNGRYSQKAEEQRTDKQKSERKKKHISRASALESLQLDPDWIELWRVYPELAGEQSPSEAAEQWLARIGEGCTPQEMLAGLHRYRANCEAVGRLGTQFVMHAKKFLGPEKHFSKPWPLPATKADKRLAAHGDTGREFMQMTETKHG